MRITDITTKIVNISSFTNWIFVFVHTNYGIVGIGESTLDGYDADVVKSIEIIGRHLIGKNPLNTILPWKRRPNLIYNAALSGLDIALWDIRGKYHNKPIYTLLGEHPNTEIPMYVTFNRVLKSRDANSFQKIANHLVNELGNRAIKFAPFDLFTSNGFNDHAFIRDGGSRVAAIREGIGTDTKLMVDCHWRFNYPDAIKAADRIRDHDIFWYEAPVSEKDPRLVSMVRAKTGLKIAGFEMQTKIAYVKDYIKHDAMDVFMPDIKYIGGISKMMEINTLIRSANKLISPHNMTGPVASLASMHVSANFENLVHLEYHVNEAEYIPALSDFEIKLKDGKHQLSDKPGLGIELNMAELDKYPYKPTVSFRQNMLGG